MYENNIYIKNAAKVKAYSGDIGVQLDKFDNDHKLKHNSTARAEYKYWVLSKSVGTEKAKTQMSVTERQLLGI